VARLRHGVVLLHHQVHLLPQIYNRLQAHLVNLIKKITKIKNSYINGKHSRKGHRFWSIISH
jgi:hypothetical protein